MALEIKVTMISIATDKVSNIKPQLVINKPQLIQVPNIKYDCELNKQILKNIFKDKNIINTYECTRYKIALRFPTIKSKHHI
jgi:hypothetical protein